MEQMYSCPNCGSLIYYGEPACQNCGIEMDWSAVEQPEPLDEYQYQEYYPEEQQWDQQEWEQPTGEVQQEYTRHHPGMQRRTLKKRKVHKQGKGFGEYLALFNKHRKIIGIAILALLCVVIAGTAIAIGLGHNPFVPASSGQINGSTTPSGSEPAAQPVAGPIDIIVFKAEPSVIPGGQNSTLSWEVSGADTVTIDQDIGTVPAKGNKVVSPMANTTYRLTATNSGGSETATITISVNVTLPIISFTATPDSISSGQSSTLKWDVKGATSIKIDKSEVAPSGQKVVSPTSTTTYTLEARNSAGLKEVTVTVSIGSAGKPVITSFTSTPELIASDGTARLEWYVTNATSVSINQGIGTVSLYGSRDVTPASTTEYTLTATNSAGSTTMTTTVAVSSSGQPVITRFRAMPPTITTGGSSTLDWVVAGATSMFIDQNIGTIPATGTHSVSPTATTTYTLTATNDKGTVTATATVNFSTVPPPAINYFQIDNDTIFVGQSTILRWSVTGADSISINQGIGAVSPVDIWTITPSSAGTITYTITATNSLGDTDTASVTLTVQ